MDNLPFEKKKKKKFGSDAISQASQDSGYFAEGVPLLPMHPTTAPSVAQAIKAGADPKVLNKAKQLLNSQQFNGLCQKFAETVTGSTQHFASAIAAFNAQKDKISTDFKNMPIGSQLFYAPDKGNGGYGHTTIYQGNGKQIGATYTGVKSSNIKDWISQTNQKLIGYLPPS